MQTLIQNRLVRSVFPPTSPLSPTSRRSLNTAPVLPFRPNIEQIRSLADGYAYADEIDILTDQLCQRLPFRRVSPHSSNLVRTAKLYAASADIIYQEAKAYAQFALQVSLARFVPRDQASNYNDVFRKMARADALKDLPEYLQRLKDGRLALRADILSRSNSQIIGLLAESLRESARIVYRQFFGAIVHLREQTELGKIAWIKRDVCELNFALYPISLQPFGLTKKHKRVIDEYHRHQGRSEEIQTQYEEIAKTNLRVTRYASSCTTTMVGVRCLRFPARLVPKPERLAPLFETAPVSLRPLLYIIDGLQTYASRDQRILSASTLNDVTIAQKTWWESRYIHTDPCLAIGPLFGPTTVLAAWNYEDLGGEERYFAEIRRLRHERLKLLTGYSAAASVVHLFRRKESR